MLYYLQKDISTSLISFCKLSINLDNKEGKGYETQTPVYCHDIHVCIKTMLHITIYMCYILK